MSEGRSDVTEVTDIWRLGLRGPGERGPGDGGMISAEFADGIRRL